MDRQLVYVGPRGTDAASLSSLDPQASVYSLIAPAVPAAPGACLETLSNVRVDLNRHSLDDDLSGAADRFRESVLAALSERSTVIPYSSWRFLSEGAMTVPGASILGLFHERRSCFDHKPWVESEVRKWGISTIPWQYARYWTGATGAAISLPDAPIVVRRPKSQGGAGIWLIRDEEDRHRVEFPASGGILCVAPYYDDSIPVNVNACVFPGGEVTFHGTSLQLIGIDALSAQPLGYAGNDFGSSAELPGGVLSDLEAMVRALGRWLDGNNYIGAFGLDALVVGKRVLFVELNPRFQASSAVSSLVSGALGESDQFLEHMAAFLGLEAGVGPSLLDLAERQKPLSYVIVYNGYGAPVTLHRQPFVGGYEVRSLPAPGLPVEDQGVLGALLFDARVTDTGLDLRPEAHSGVADLLRCFALQTKPNGPHCAPLKSTVL